MARDARSDSFAAMKMIVCLLGILAAGCAATIGTGGTTYVPKNAASTCAAHCGEIGLALNSVVIMANNVGCVCSAAATASGGAASGGGMAALLMAAESRNSSTSAAPFTPGRR